MSDQGRGDRPTLTIAAMRDAAGTSRAPGTAHVGAALLAVMLGLTAAAAWGLRLDAATPPGERLGWVDAGFTAASAATCTGLETRGVADALAWPGRMIVLATGQVGAWAVMVAGAAVACRAFSLRWSGWRRTAGGVVLVTLALEALTGLMLWLVGGSFDPAALPGCLMEGVGAVTQSGFAWSEFAATPRPVAVVLLPAMLVGSMGYPVWVAAWHTLRRRGGGDPAGRRHALRVIRLTAAAFLLGAAVLALGQATPFLHTALHLGVQGHGRYAAPVDADAAARLVRDAAGLSASARSTGRAVVPPGGVEPAARVALVPLMLLGGGLGSAAGGLGLWVLARPRHTDHTGQHTAAALSRAAASLFAVYALLIVAAWFVLVLVEPYPPDRLLFEAVSATTNAGLTTGLTPSLTATAQATLTAAMLLGRVLPLALLGHALANPPPVSDHGDGEEGMTKHE